MHVSAAVTNTRVSTCFRRSLTLMLLKISRLLRPSCRSLWQATESSKTRRKIQQFSPSQCGRPRMQDSCVLSPCCMVALPTTLLLSYLAHKMKEAGIPVCGLRQTTSHELQCSDLPVHQNILPPMTAHVRLCLILPKFKSRPLFLQVLGGCLLR